MIVITLIVMLGCDSDKNPVEPETGSGLYFPMKVGNEWQYTRTVILPEAYLEIDTNLTSNIINEYYVQKLKSTDYLFDSVATYILEETATIDNSTLVSNGWLANEKDGLYFYAYRQPVWLILKQSPKNKILFGDRYFNSVPEVSDYLINAASVNQVMIDSMIYEDPPLLSLQYPLETGARWDYRTHSSPISKIEKVVLGKEQVEVPAGKFECYKIQWLFEYDPEWYDQFNVEFYDFVSKKGLIKRTLTYSNVMQVAIDDSTTITINDTTYDEYVLTGLSLN